MFRHKKLQTQYTTPGLCLRLSVCVYAMTVGRTIVPFLSQVPKSNASLAGAFLAECRIDCQGVAVAPSNCLLTGSVIDLGIMMNRNIDPANHPDDLTHNVA